jgi:hypothetical protein
MPPVRRAQHVVHPALDTTAPDVATCHLPMGAPLPSMALQDLDPSLAVGLLCPSAPSFDALCDACAAICARCLAPFSVTETPPRIPFDLAERAASAGTDDDDELCLL